MIFQSNKDKTYNKEAMLFQEGGGQIFGGMKESRNPLMGDGCERNQTISGDEKQLVRNWQQQYS